MLQQRGGVWSSLKGYLAAEGRVEEWKCVHSSMCVWGSKRVHLASRSAAAEGRLELWKGVWSNRRMHGIVGGLWSSNREVEQGSVQEVGAWSSRRMLGQ